MRPLNNMAVVVDPFSVGPAFQSVPMSLTMAAQVARNMHRGEGCMPLTAQLNPSQVVVNFDTKTATIHESDCQSGYDDFRSTDGLRQIGLPWRGFALQVIKELALQEQQCPHCAPAGT